MVTVWKTAASKLWFLFLLFHFYLCSECHARHPGSINHGFFSADVKVLILKQTSQIRVLWSLKFLKSKLDHYGNLILHRSHFFKKRNKPTDKLPNLRKSPFLATVEQQCGHWYLGTFFPCLCNIWNFRVPDWVNLALQLTHSKGFSPKRKRPG